MASKRDHFVRSRVSEFRSRVGVGATSPIDFDHILYKLKVLTLFKPLSENFSGMAIKTEKKCFILINSRQSVGRQNFTLGHELYHLFVQEEFVPHRCTTGKFDQGSDQEYLADLFSANLLMPTDGLYAHIPPKELGKNRISIGTLLSLEQIFKVSHTALMYRLLGMGLIDTEYLDKYKTDVINKAKMYGFDTTLYEPGNHRKVIGDYAIIAEELFQEGKISESHFHELMEEFTDGEE